MRFKYYIRGFGLGVIFATLILMVGFSLHGGMTNEQIRKEAQKLGMVEQEDNKKNSQNLEKSSQTEKQESSESQLESQKDSQMSTETPIESQPESQPESEKEPPKEEFIYITVDNGDTCRMVGQKLLDKQIISDVEEFRSYFSSIHMANSFHVGTYKIPLNATYEELAKILVW